MHGLSVSSIKHASRPGWTASVKSALVSEDMKRRERPASPLVYLLLQPFGFKQDGEKGATA
jgi:hypothetical protein